jgi:hypothetical protein
MRGLWLILAALYGAVVVAGWGLIVNGPARVLVSDGSGFADQCCWTNGYVRVSVGPAWQGQKP